MNFLSFVIALSLHQVITTGSALQRDDWLHAYDGFLTRFIPASSFRLLLLLLSLALAADGLLDWLGAWLFGLPMLLAAALILLWSLGREDYHTALECFEARYEADRKAACEAAAVLWAPPEDREEAADADSDSEEALQRLAYSGYERWFGPVFYFVVLGPVGALLYRVVAILAKRDDAAAALSLLYWVHWIPARLLALTFALTGDFVAVVQNHPAMWFMEHRSVPSLLRETAACACKGVEGARAISSIMYRSAGLWLLIISLGFMFL